MDFAPSARVSALSAQLASFLDGRVYQAEEVFARQLAEGDGHKQPEILEELKREARELGLWNLFLPHRTPWHEPLTNLEYAPLAELTGRSPLAAEAMNCSAPDTGNMELLALFGTDAQKQQWLKPLLDGEIRSSYAMTEPDVASSDASNIRTTIRRDGDEWVITGRKWWISGVQRERCTLMIVMGVSEPEGDRHQRHSMVLVPLDTPGITVRRELTVLGYNPFESHVELELDEVRVPIDNLLGDAGAGFAMAQARLGPGRIHHCMRLVGAAERALELMCRRASERVAFGSPLSEQGVIREWIADSRVEIDQARCYTLYTAWLMDTVGNRGAASQISGIKVVAPSMALRVIDRAIQVHGAAGLSDDLPMARMFADARILRFADGPDEVHRRAVARTELRLQTLARQPRPRGAQAHLLLGSEN